VKSYNFDGHKLMYHLDRVHEYFTRNDCYPLYMEISPVGSCNHRCIFCAYDFIGYPNRRLETTRTLTLLDELAEIGLKSVLFAGEGEPLLHPDLDSFITHARTNGIDAGLFTNGQLLTPGKADRLIPALRFIRFSFNGGNATTYAQVHHVQPEAFNQVIDAMRNAVAVKRRQTLETTVGAQFVVIPENIDSLVEAVYLLREIGVDYVAIKPFVQQSGQQGYQLKQPLDARQLDACLSSAEALSTDTFAVMARRSAFSDYGSRRYAHCYGTSFISTLNSAGDVATCLPYWDNSDFVFGNIHGQTFREIWNSPRRAEIKTKLEEHLKVRECPPNCRPNAVNEFLFELKFPSVEHINFI